MWMWNIYWNSLENQIDHQSDAVKNRFFFFGSYDTCDRCECSSRRRGERGGGGF